METTQEKASREEREYRLSIKETETFGQKLSLIKEKPELLSFYYPGNDILCVNIHGGGFCFKHPLDNDAYCRYVNEKFHVSILSCDYTSSSLQPYPTQLEEMQEQIKAFLSLHPEIKKIILAGHSSGANLAFATGIIWDRNETKMRLSGLVLDYPFLNLTIPGKDRPTFPNAWPDSLIDDWISLYAPKEEDRKNPVISPLFLSDEEFKKLPPIVISSPSRDRLKDDSLALNKRLEEAKMPHLLIPVEERHGFVERNMRRCYSDPEDPIVKNTESVVDKEYEFILTTLKK